MLYAVFEQRLRVHVLCFAPCLGFCDECPRDAEVQADVVTSKVRRYVARKIEWICVAGHDWTWKYRLLYSDHVFLTNSNCLCMLSLTGRRKGIF